jgi:CP family cyanate transporter-like MFS transporter
MLQHLVVAVAMPVSPRSVSQRSAAGTALLVLGIVLVAANLRGPVTALAPVLDRLQAHFALGSAAAGLLTTLPLLVFAAVSPFAAGLAGRHGLERALFAGFALIVAGLVLRITGSAAALYGGMVVLAVGIALGNVLLPGLVKRDFPRHVALLTSAYSLVMGAVAALGSALAVPLAARGGWPLALGSLGAVALLGLLVWLPQLRRHDGAGAGAGSHYRGIWRHGLAWQVTLFLGFNSFIYYTLIGWLPSMLAGSGYSAAAAGRLHGAMQIGVAVAGLLVAALIRYRRDQRALALLMVLLEIAGLLGLWLLPQWSGLWALLFGAGNGAVFILALSFVGLRSATPAQAASLSGMAQCLGYLMAAAGPALMGLLHDAVQGWGAVMLVCVALCAAMAVAGVMAGRDRQIG